MIKKIGALIITYNPDIEILKKNINSIGNQVDKVLIVDNASKNINEINLLNEVIIKNPVNYGIAKALNIGMSYFYDNNYQWVITLDQDSVCPNDMIQKYNSFIHNDTVGILCPLIKYIGWPSLVIPQIQDETTTVTACMTSASYTNVLAWKNVNGFNESYFIDYVDNDFCMKLHLANYRIVRVNSLILEHNLGKCGEVYLLKRIPLRYCLHSPIRYYYIVRNMLYFNKIYKKELNKTREGFKIIYIIMSALFWEKEKRQIVTYINKAFNDYKKGIMGEISITN